MELLLYTLAIELWPLLFTTLSYSTELSRLHWLVSQLLVLQIRRRRSSFTIQKLGFGSKRRVVLFIRTGALTGKGEYVALRESMKDKVVRMGQE